MALEIQNDASFDIEGLLYPGQVFYPRVADVIIIHSLEDAKKCSFGPLSETYKGRVFLFKRGEIEEI
jgi:hypothetical protein